MEPKSVVRLGLGLILAGALQACNRNINLPAAPIPMMTDTPTYTSTAVLASPTGTASPNPFTPTWTVTGNPTPNWPNTSTPTPIPDPGTAIPTGSPTPIWTNTYTPSPITDPGTATSTWTLTGSPTPFNTPTNTLTGSPTPTGTWFTPTATATGCGKLGGSSSLPINPVSAGWTVVGLSFSIYLCCTNNCGAGVYPVFTSFNFNVAISGNLASQILKAQLWNGGTLLGTSTISGNTLSFTGFSTTNITSVTYVLSPTASGVIDTSLTFGGFSGYLYTPSGPGPIWPEPGFFNVDSGPMTVSYLTVTPTSTSTFTFTPTNTQTPIPTLAAWGTQGTGNGQFTGEGGLAADAQGNIYASDTLGDRIEKFDTNGIYLAQWGSTGSGNGQFSGPEGIAVDHSASCNGTAGPCVFVVDAGNNRVEKFDSAGNYISQFGALGYTPGFLDGPAGLAIDAAGNFYISDINGTQYIQKFDSTGAFVTSWGSDGSGNGQFYNPFSVAVDNAASCNGTPGPCIYVGDSSNNRIQKFDSAGNYLAQWGSSGYGNGQFANVTAVAVSPSGYLYVTDYFQVQKFDLNGNFQTYWDRKSPAGYQYYGFEGLAIDPSGNEYVDALVAPMIRKFAPR